MCPAPRPSSGPARGSDHRPDPDLDRARALALALHASPKLDRATVCRLAAAPAGWHAAARADPETARRLGVPTAQLDLALAAVRDGRGRARREAEAAAALGARLVTRFDADYPAPLLDLALPPPVLAVRGELTARRATAGTEPAPGEASSGSGDEPREAGRAGGAPENGAALPAPRRPPAVAVVGSRAARAYGRQVAALFADRLAAAGVLVVSGFARGVDAAAHEAALEAGGRTIAVLGCGIGYDYPREHRDLGVRIAASGALVSELPCGTPPRRWHFPVRNRLIAAWAAATLVVEATARSGSLSTARHALELGREVWAVPGRIFDERARGTNALLRDGAFPALTPRDLLEALGLPRGDEERALGGARRPGARQTPAERLLAALPWGEELGAEELAAESARPVDRVLATLLELELAGRVRRLPGGLYRRSER